MQEFERLECKMPKTKKVKKRKQKVKKASSKTVKNRKTAILKAKSMKLVKKSPVVSQKTQNTIFAISGETGVKVINFLQDRQNVSEFLIADKLRLDMQTIRYTLYKIHTHNVATYIKRKDRQKG